MKEIKKNYLNELKMLAHDNPVVVIHWSHQSCVPCKDQENKLDKIKNPFIKLRKIDLTFPNKDLKGFKKEMDFNHPLPALSVVVNDKYSEYNKKRSDDFYLQKFSDYRFGLDETEHLFGQIENPDLYPFKALKKLGLI